MRGPIPDVTCWLRAPHADIAYSVLLKVDSHTLRQGDYYQGRQDRAHARFLKATRALATVRRLLVPAVQVNVAEKQIITQQAGVPSAAAVRDAADG